MLLNNYFPKIHQTICQISKDQKKKKKKKNHQNNSIEFLLRKANMKTFEDSF